MCHQEPRQFDCDLRQQLLRADHRQWGDKPPCVTRRTISVLNRSGRCGHTPNGCTQSGDGLAKSSCVETSSTSPGRDERRNEMEECTVDGRQQFATDQQSTEAVEPRDGAFRNPTEPVAARVQAVLLGPNDSEPALGLQPAFYRFPAHAIAPVPPHETAAPARA
jgi:hypothetical protein